MKLVSCRFEWKLEDLWIGVFWKYRQMYDAMDSEAWNQLDIWICFLPCIPLHIRLEVPDR